MNFWASSQDFVLAQQHSQAGRLAEAELLCKRILSASSGDTEALHLLGTTLSRSGRHDEAIAALEQAVALQPKNHVFATNLGAVYAAAKKFDAAVQCFRAAIAIKPSIPESHYNLANALKDLNQAEGAITAYRKALQIKPNYPAAWNNLGAIYTQLHKLPEATTAIKRAIAINPDYAAAHNNLANVYLLEGNIKACIASCAKALTLKPDYVDAIRSLGQAYLASLDHASAVACYEKVIAIEPNSARSYVELAHLQIQCSDFEGVVGCLQKVIGLEPEHEEAWKLTGIVQMERGFYLESDIAFKKALAINPRLSTKIRYALALPPVLASGNDIDIVRQQLDEKLEMLFAEILVTGDQISDPYLEQIGPNFFLAYHARNDREIQIKIAALYEKACPSLTFMSPHIARPVAEQRKKRIGFFSKFIYKHSVAFSFGRVIEQISKNSEFEIFLISTTDNGHQDVEQMYPSFDGAFVCIPNQLSYAQQFISVLQLDILTYLDIGMDPFSFLLAFSRLAPVQCVMGGHPVTTGISTLDYFLAPAQAEPENGQAHYSEKLVRLESGGFYFERPKPPGLQKSRQALGLPEFGRIYLCPMMLQKIHPAFDAVIAKILALDAEGHVVLFESPQHVTWNRLLSERLDRALPADLRTRVHFHPWISDSDDFALTIRAADVVLDPIHFGIGSTAIPVFSVGTPIITWPGEFMRGRVGYAYCRMLDIEECIAIDFEDYAQKAVLIATDKEARNVISKKILANNHVLFENNAASSELAEFFKSVT